eukprot:scaffold25184_cov90-Attheya_sp.AAC.1
MSTTLVEDSLVMIDPRTSAHRHRTRPWLITSKTGGEEMWNNESNQSNTDSRKCRFDSVIEICLLYAKRTSASAATVVGFCRCRLDRVFYCMTCRQRLEVSRTAGTGKYQLRAARLTTCVLLFDLNLKRIDSLFRGQQLNSDVSKFISHNG